MGSRLWAISLLVASSAAMPHLFPRQGTGPPLIQSVPKYDTKTNYRDVTEWLAIGDSFSSGISADVPSDELNNHCTRYKMSYPNQMQNDPRFPGHSTSRKFTFGSCTGDKMGDVTGKQIELGTPTDANNPKIGNPQVVTLSMSGNDLGFGDIVNNCLYHWFGYHDCSTFLRAAHTKLDDPNKIFELEMLDAMVKILLRLRSTSSGGNVQMYVTGYVRFWNDKNDQCNDVSWASYYVDEGKLSIALREDMNSLVVKLNALIKKVVETVNSEVGGVWFVEDFDAAFDGHRFCEQETDKNYHKNPIDKRTWFIHYNSPYANPSVFATPADFFKAVDAVLIPPKDGVSTEDQIKAVNGDYKQLNPAYANFDSFGAALKKLAEDDPEKYSVWPTTWLRVMHPKGSGYKAMADAVISKFISAQAQEAPPPPPPSPPPPPPAATKQVIVFYDNYIDEIGNVMYWSFFQTAPGSGAKLCETRENFQTNAPGTYKDLDNPPRPKGSWKMKLHDQDDCEYANDGNGPGTIKCPGMNDPKNCEEAVDTKQYDCKGLWADTYREVARCQW